MKLTLKGMKIELFLPEMVDIINGRQKAALMNTTMDNGKENLLSEAYNDGVNMMAKYMRDWFGNAFDALQYQQNMNGGDE